MSKLRPRPQKNYPNYNWDDLDRTIQTILSDPLYKVCHIDPSLYAIPKDEIISECISAGYTVEECEDGILNISWLAKLAAFTSRALILVSKSIDTSIGFFLFPLYGYRLGFILSPSYYLIPYRYLV